jgi:UDPglucose 6-dehydrogenase
MRVAIIEAGDAGLASGASLAEVGHVATFIDKDPRKIERLNSGETLIFEPGLEPLAAANVREGRLSFAAGAPGRGLQKRSSC